MSLPDAIKNLRDVVKMLSTAKFDPKLDALKKFVESITITKAVTPTGDVLAELLAKILRGDENFTRRELRNLPFIIYAAEITVDDAVKILRRLNFFHAGQLRSLVTVYLLNYDGSAKTELIRRQMNLIPSDMSGNSLTLRKIFAAREYLFDNERFANMSKLFARKLSVEGTLETLGLSNFFKTSQFVHVALKNFFRTNAELPARIEILQRLDEDFFAYEDIFPVAASVLIQAVENLKADYAREICLDVFYRRLSDPRFGGRRFRWNDVDSNSREIFCRWLCAKDLEVFFKLVAETSDDKQWRYREKFWRAYLPRISNTWIFLGKKARRIAAKLSNLNHGSLKGENGNQSVLVFRIGRHIFSEWSNIGKVRVHGDNQQYLFGLYEVDGDFIRKNFVMEWAHSSPQTYFWQRQVRDWIERNC